MNVPMRASAGICHLRAGLVTNPPSCQKLSKLLLLLKLYDSYHREAIVPGPTALLVIRNKCHITSTDTPYTRLGQVLLYPHDRSHSHRSFPSMLPLGHRCFFVHF